MTSLYITQHNLRDTFPATCSKKYVNNVCSLENSCRPYYGKPSRPTTARPAPMQLNIDMEEHEAVMEERVTRMRRVCSQAGGALSNKNKPYNNGT